MTEQEDKDLTEYRDKAMQRRGAFINEVISLERMVDYFIACHLCKTEEKRQEICELILGTERIGFGGKKQIFQAIREKSDKIKKDEEATARIVKYLENTIRRRNTLAHIQLSMRIEDAVHFKQTSEITFVHYTNKIGFHKYSRERFQKYLDEIHDCMLLINEINKQWA